MRVLLPPTGVVALLAQLLRALFVQVLEALQVSLGLVLCMRVA